MAEHKNLHCVSVSLDPRFHRANLPMAEKLMRRMFSEFNCIRLSRPHSHRFEMVMKEEEWREKEDVLLRFGEKYGEILSIKSLSVK